MPVRNSEQLNSLECWSVFVQHSKVIEYGNIIKRLLANRQLVTHLRHFDIYALLNKSYNLIVLIIILIVTSDNLELLYCGQT